MPSASDYKTEVSRLGSTDELAAWLRSGIGNGVGYAEQVARASAAANYARHFDQGTFRVVLGAHGSLESFSRNPHLPRPMQEYVRDACLKALRQWTSAGGAGMRGEKPHLCRALQNLAAAGVFRTDGPDGESLLAALMPMRTKLRKTTVGMFEVLAGSPATPSHILEALAVDANEGELIDLARHPNATLPVWTQMLAGDWKRGAMLTLAEISAARKHPEVRTALRAFGAFSSPDVLRCLLADVEQDDLAVVFRALALRFPNKALSFLANASEEQKTRLEGSLQPQELAPLLASPNQELRLAGIALSGRLAGAEAKRAGARPAARP